MPKPIRVTETPLAGRPYIAERKVVVAHPNSNKQVCFHPYGAAGRYLTALNDLYPDSGIPPHPRYEAYSMEKATAYMVIGETGHLVCYTLSQIVAKRVLNAELERYDGGQTSMCLE